MQKTRDGVPAYQRIQNAIRKRIESGHLRPGDSVDSERDLARIHQVSLMTARHALVWLEREGVVERRRGIGTFVAAPKIHFNKLMSYTEQMASRSLTASSKILVAKVIYDEQEIAARLALPPNSGVIKLERLRHSSDEPFALETCYFSSTEFPDLLSAPLGRESLCHGRRPTHRGADGRSSRSSLAAHPSADLFHQRQSHYLCAGLLSLRPAQAFDSPVPLD